MRLTLTAALLAALPLAVQANDTTVDDRSWSGTAEFGLAIASGNADSETVNGKFAFLREEDRWFYGLNAAALRAKSDDRLSANRYEAGLKLGYDFTGRAYLFGSLRHENDDFASYEYQSIASLGMGYRFIDRQGTSLLGEIGPGARRVQPIDVLSGTPPVPTPVPAETSAIVRGSLDFQHALTANTALTNLLLAESGGGNTFLQNDLGVAVQMSDRYALKAGYQLRRTSEVPVGVSRTDRLFTTNLVVGF